MYVRHEVNMQLAVVFYHSPCCIIFRTKFFYLLSCIECIHVSWCTTVRNKSIIMIIIIITKVLSERRLLENVQEWWEENSTVILRAGQEVLGMTPGRRPPGDKETWWWNDDVKDAIRAKKEAKKKWDAS